MEKGKVYNVGRSQLVSWSARFFFASVEGLCYQHVSRKFRPAGKRKVIPWDMITKVEALLDDSIYVETIAAKK